jgi:hypothetical protein
MPAVLTYCVGTAGDHDGGQYKGADMSTPASQKAARTLVNQTIGELMDEFSGDSAEKIFQRFSSRMKSDASLRDAFLLSGFQSICDETFDDLVRLGLRVPDGLKKPS